jgi:hypothetical protein
MNDEQQIMMQKWMQLHLNWTFAKFKYLVTTELTIATLFAPVFVLGIRFHAVGFFAFPTGSLVVSWKPIEPPSSFVASHQLPSAVPVKFLNDSAKRAARILRGAYYALKEHSASGQGGSSDQMVLKKIRWGRLVR